MRPIPTLGSGEALVIDATTNKNVRTSDALVQRQPTTQNQLNIQICNIGGRTETTISKMSRGFQADAHVQ